MELFPQYLSQLVHCYCIEIQLNFIYGSCILQPCWTCLLALTIFFFSDSLGFSVYKIMSSTNRRFYFFLSKLDATFLPNWLELPVPRWTEGVRAVILALFLFLFLRKKHEVNLWVFHRCPLSCWGGSLLFLVFWVFFIMKQLILSSTFPASSGMIMWVLLFTVFTWYITLIFYIALTWHSWYVNVLVFNHLISYWIWFVSILLELSASTAIGGITGLQPFWLCCLWFWCQVALASWNEVGSVLLFTFGQAFLIKS